MVSFWERKSFLTYDIIIVGAGITGLSAAASLKEKAPNLSVLVLERGTLPTGASTKNAGFACFGSISELAQDLKALGESGMVNLVSRRWKGLQKTSNRLGPDRIDLQQKGGYELLTANNAHYLHDLSTLNDLLKPIFPSPVFADHTSQLDTFGFKNTKHLIFNPFEGQLDTGKLMKSLWQYCQQLGVQVLTGTEVSAIQPEKQGVSITTPTLTFHARAAGICTNAFTNKLLQPSVDITPGRGMVMLVKPKKTLPFEGTFHYDEGYFYFRDFHGKLIFGGGRNLALAEEQTEIFGLNPRIEQKLLEDLNEIILPNSAYEVEMKWSGIMAFGPTKNPLIEALGDHRYLAARLGGMGVALGSLAGDDLADLILQGSF
ncbi:NAD(P)/FAD-dependent oxidoreductase [Marinoscillum furvescens]|uniref:Glycine/D-amino acid oxidase-like deaminating enzyme n=1 Tax=Marinoscillum furvescens DSM 4134 TaxID=1122208 RepID=A0A3D9L5S6_MARFU|nr:FAD-dependent oxidoreductase [Marinoscillum furvescens]REE01036.1 glycine/D-amino acid oxidase-like deaminating enzyme [Marinoscillum furvescens DSM 4134]